MTKDDILRMAREAGFNSSNGFSALIVRHSNGSWIDVTDDLERFANLVAAAERKACAALAEKTICDKHIPTGVSIYGTRAATAIRARGTT